MTGHIDILVAEPSEVIRRGLRAVLTTEESVPVVVYEVGRAEMLHEALLRHRPDVVIVNPGFGAFLSPAAIRKEFPGIRCVVLASSPGDEALSGLFDDVVSVWDSAHTIRTQILHPFRSVTKSARRQREPLSQREKDVVACVVRGLTNRQIADRLHLSHHTVGTHRRNISSKLGIHSTSGLTVYAISSKLVSLEEIYGGA